MFSSSLQPTVSDLCMFSCAVAHIRWLCLLAGPHLCACCLLLCCQPHVSCHLKARNALGFTDDPQRLNVAVTRAKRGLIIVGHFTTLRYGDGYGNLASLLDSLSATRFVLDYDLRPCTAPTFQHSEHMVNKPKVRPLAKKTVLTKASWTPTVTKLLTDPCPEDIHPQHIMSSADVLLSSRPFAVCVSAGLASKCISTTRTASERLRLGLEELEQLERICRHGRPF